MIFAQELVNALVALEVEYIFGVSGANIEHLHDAIYHNSEITSILAKTEIGAAYMADARARKTNKLTVCCSTSGAGIPSSVVTSIIMGGSNFSAQIPVSIPGVS